MRRHHLMISAGLVLCVTGGLSFATEERATSATKVALTPEERKQADICQENLAKIDGAKEQFALEFKKANDTTVTWENLLDPAGKGRLGEGYLKKKPVCPAGGVYSVKHIGSNPTCSIGAEKEHVLQ